MNLVPYLVIVPLAAGFFIPIFGKRVKFLDRIIAFFATLILFLLSLYIAYVVKDGKVLSYSVSKWSPPAGLSMVVDGLSSFMLVIVNMVTFLVAVYSAEYVKRYTDRWKFFSLFMLMVAGMNGVLLSGDIFNLYVFLEVAAISAYALVAFGVEARELEASFKYAVMGAVGSSFIVLGIAFLYSYASTLNMADISLSIIGSGSNNVVLFASVLFLMGFGLKSALIPFHAWLPDAHSTAPTPISAMLSGLLIKVLGVYSILRIFFNVFGMPGRLSSMLIILAVVSMIAASILAFGQKDIKRLLAYSTISQVGYIILGFGVGTPLAVMGALFHMLNHSIFKPLLFLSSGAIETITGTRDIRLMPGIIKKSPVTAYTNLIGSLSICGFPPFGGFWSKIIIIFACIQAGRPILAFIAAAVGILTIGYYFNAITPILFGTEKGIKEYEAGENRLALAIILPMVALAALSVLSVLILSPAVGRAFLNDAIAAVVRGKDYAVILMGSIR